MNNLSEILQEININSNLNDVSSQNPKIYKMIV